MNIFEDLIDELKKDNLLEETVIETKGLDNKADLFDDEIIEAQTFLENYAKEEKVVEPAALTEPELKTQTANEVVLNAPLLQKKHEHTPESREKTKQQQLNDIESYRKRATDEVSCLQLVEHIFSGVERDQMKVVPKNFDDLETQKSLHKFLQLSKEANPSEHAQAEFQLMQETESWYSTLSNRDRHISTAHLRRFCETTRPVLSIQALAALARFYRNSPYSESVRNKFDFTVTKLFSVGIENSKRELAIGKSELVENLTRLYNEWESIRGYSNEDNDSKMLITTLKFEDFIAEAENADSFDELIRNDFFNRVRGFKENTKEEFFEPLVTATGIESNIRIGNRYIELLELEVEKGAREKLENKYGFLHDQVISDATSKTLQLVDLLNPTDEKDEIGENSNQNAELSRGQETAKDKSVGGKAEALPKPWYKVNKWLLVTTVLAIFFSASIFIWERYNATADKVSTDVKLVNLDNSSLQEFIKDARINNDNFYAIVLPVWNASNREKKEEMLKKILAIGNEKGFKTVFLLNEQGAAVGSASSDGIEIF